MIVPGSVNPLLLATGGYEVPYSLRFRRANSAYLSRTMGTPTNDKICTWSFWAKRGTLGTTAGELLFYSAAATGGGIAIFFDSVSPNAFRMYTASGTRSVTSSSVFRDTSAWYHFVIAYDSTEATSSNRFKVWVNNLSLLFTGSFPDLNHACSWNVSGGTSYFGSAGGPFADSRDYIDGYRAECYFIDGQALTPSSFGQTDSATGVWVPKKYSGTYGTNGFYLKFADASAATAAAIGKDSSGNGNNWTPSGISVTSGVTYDQMTDTPTLNYCVMSAVDRYSTTVNPSDGNLAIVNSSGGSYQSIRSTVAMTTGKWYCEGVITASGSLPAARTGAGLYTSTDPLSTYGGVYATSWAYFSGGTAVNNNVSTTLTSGSLALNDVFQIAFDADAGKLWFGKNGTWLNSGDPATGANAIYSSLAAGTYFIGGWAYNTADKTVMNFGQRAFSYTPPTGFKALNTANLPTPSIKKGSLYMDATLRTGTGATASVSSLGFQPDLVWIKSRSAATDHGLYDAVRGVQKQLESNTTTDETTETTGLTAFSSNGYTVGALAQLNTSSATYVDWAWKEGATPGFDIVTYTGNGVARTISHTLGAVPKFMIVKARSTAGADQGWPVYHAANTAAPETDYLLLNSTAGTADLDTVWNDTAPTASVFSVGTSALVNTNSDTYVAYLWSEIEGFSKFGSYTGNGSTDGPFVWCGFRPRWVLTKRSDAADAGAVLKDSARDTYNPVSATLIAATALAEASYAASEIDFLSNGFKLRNSGTANNTSGGTFVFAAFAENPFKYARAR